MVNLHYVVNSHMCDRYKYCHVWFVFVNFR
jgi:hypothetical protein